MTAWFAFSVNHVFGPYYSESPIVIGASYKLLWTRYFLPVLPHIFFDTTFQQYKTSSHYRWEEHQLLDKNLPNLWIGRKRPTTWPPRLPSLTPLYFLIDICKR